MVNYSLEEFNTWYNSQQRSGWVVNNWIDTYQKHGNNWTTTFLDAHGDDEYSSRLRTWMALVDTRERERESQEVTLVW
jgi:hypothetical protein